MTIRAFLEQLLRGDVLIQKKEMEFLTSEDGIKLQELESSELIAILSDIGEEDFVFKSSHPNSLDALVRATHRWLLFCRIMRLVENAHHPFTINYVMCKIATILQQRLHKARNCWPEVNDKHIKLIVSVQSKVLDVLIKNQLKLCIDPRIEEDNKWMLINSIGMTNRPVDFFTTLQSIFDRPSIHDQANLVKCLTYTHLLQYATIDRMEDSWIKSYWHEYLEFAKLLIPQVPIPANASQLVQDLMCEVEATIQVQSLLNRGYALFEIGMEVAKEAHPLLLQKLQACKLQPKEMVRHLQFFIRCKCSSSNKVPSMFIQWIQRIVQGLIPDHTHEFEHHAPVFMEFETVKFI